MAGSLNKNLERLNYIILLVSLNTGYIVCLLLTLYFRIFKNRKTKTGDVIFFPYTQSGSDGYKRRIGQYEELFTLDGIRYKVCNIYDDKTIINILDSGKTQSYKLYRYIFWKRLHDVLLVSKYKTVFVQRSIFPFYPDQTFPYLEKLAFTLNKNIIIDFWDSVWKYNEKLTDKSVDYCSKIACVNTFVADHFSFCKAEKVVFPISMQLDSYLTKSDYRIEKPYRFIYTGNPANVESFLEIILPVLSELQKTIDLVLVLVTRHRCETGCIKTEFHDFSENTFYNLLAGSDIALYAIDDSEISRGKMAMKVLDYMASALPIVASPYGLPPGCINNFNILLANDFNGWINSITDLVNNYDKRVFLGKNARVTADSEHNIKLTYPEYKKLLDLKY